MELRSGNADEGRILFFEDGRGGGTRFVSGTMVRHAFPAHLHRSACFGVIAGGEAILEIYGEELLLRTGDRYAIPAMRSHALRPIGGGWFSHRVFGADPERCREIDRMLREAIGTEPSWEWPDVETMPTRASDVPDIPSAFREILAVFESEPEREWRLHELASQFGMRPASFSRAFSREVGMPVTQYLLLAKVWKSVRMLEEGAAIPDAAFDAGFADQSHLCRVFRRYMGVAPSVFRKNLLRPGGLTAARG
jgi:AraC-like DNA-binding protein